MNQIFNIKRFVRYSVAQLSFNRNLFLITPLGAFLLIIIIGLIIVSNERYYDQNDWIPFFLTTGAISAILVLGTSFPFLRKKENAQNALMLPASSFEKFMHEFLFKFAAFIISYLIIFQCASYFIEMLGNTMFAHSNIKSFSIIKAYKDETVSEKELVSLLILFIGSVLFAGSSAIKKFPLIKTILAFGLLILFIVGYFYILVEHANLDNGLELVADRFFQGKTNKEINNRFTIVLIALTALAWAYTYFNIKEKEVY